MGVKRIYRYQVPLDDGIHKIEMAGDMTIHGCVCVAADSPEHMLAVEFWAQHDEDAAPIVRSFAVVGTGHPLPGNTRYIGTCPRRGGLVWHLIEVIT